MRKLFLGHFSQQFQIFGHLLLPNSKSEIMVGVIFFTFYFNICPFLKIILVKWSCIFFFNLWYIWYTKYKNRYTNCKNRYTVILFYFIFWKKRHKFCSIPKFGHFAKTLHLKNQSFVISLVRYYISPSQWSYRKKIRSILDL